MKILSKKQEACLIRYHERLKDNVERLSKLIYECVDHVCDEDRDALTKHLLVLIDFYLDVIPKDVDFIVNELNFKRES